MTINKIEKEIIHLKPTVPNQSNLVELVLILEKVDTDDKEAKLNSTSMKIRDGERIKFNEQGKKSDESEKPRMVVFKGVEP